MSMLVKALSRLYPNKVSLDKLKVMVKENSISPEEYKEITGEEFAEKG